MVSAGTLVRRKPHFFFVLVVVVATGQFRRSTRQRRRPKISENHSTAVREAVYKGFDIWTTLDILLSSKLGEMCLPQDLLFFLCAALTATLRENARRNDTHARGESPVNRENFQEKIVVASKQSSKTHSRWVVLADEVGVGNSAGIALRRYAPKLLRRLPQDLSCVPTVVGDPREAFDLLVVCLRTARVGRYFTAVGCLR